VDHRDEPGDDDEEERLGADLQPRTAEDVFGPLLESVRTVITFKTGFGLGGTRDD
jgi:hypothetical protein